MTANRLACEGSKWNIFVRARSHWVASCAIFAARSIKIRAGVFLAILFRSCSKRVNIFIGIYSLWTFHLKIMWQGQNSYMFLLEALAFRMLPSYWSKEPSLNEVPRKSTVLFTRIYFLP